MLDQVSLAKLELELKILNVIIIETQIELSIK